MQKRPYVQRPKNEPFKTGVIQITSRGTGFVSIEGLREDILIEAENTGLALDRDTVQIAILPKKKMGRTEGRVISVVKRNRTEFVGTISKDGNRMIVIPDNRRIHTPFLISRKENIPPDSKVLVRLSKWNNPKSMPEVELVEIVGKKGENETEMKSIVLEKGLIWNFPTEVENEAFDIKKDFDRLFKEEEKIRPDFRDTTTFTIDPVDAKDFDDALSIKTLENGNFEVGIHIADVAFFVRPGTMLDKEAQKRGTSIYLVDRTIPMLPEVLSNDLCSLNPEEEKLVFSAVFELNQNGDVLKRKFARSLIRSDKRFSYEEAQKVIDSGSGPFYKELIILRDLARKINARRFKNGAISFEQDEVRFELDSDGRPLRVYRKERLETHKLIEEFMLLANREVATFVYDLGKKKKLNLNQLFLYRIHDLPNEEKIAELSIFIKALGHELPLQKQGISGRDLNALFKKIEGQAEEGIIKTATIRSMAKAIYSTKNIGHFGLGFDYYTHFTSPIRRYPDTLVHRLLSEYLSGKNVSTKEFSFYERMATETTEAEIRAAEAERESIKLKQVEFMQTKIGQTFEGVISGITEWGIYLEEKETKSEGLVKIRELIPNDYYNLDSKNYRLVGEKTKKIFSLGDPIRFKIIGADLERKTLDYQLV